MSIDPKILLAAELSGETLEPPPLQPEDQDAAEAIQDGFIRAWGVPIAGWKLGATTAPVRSRFGIPRAFWGAVPAARVLQSGATLPAGALRQPILETEVCFRLAADLPPAGGSARETVIAAIAGVCAALEIPQSRYAGPGAHGPLPLIADNGAAGLLVVGETIADWTEEGLAAAACVLTLDGEIAAEGSSEVIMGGPLQCLIEFVAQAHARGYTPSAGDYVSTGGCANAFDFSTPVKAKGTILGVGTVELELL